MVELTLVQRLRICCPDPEKFRGEPHWPREAVVELCQEAADEIEQKSERIKRLEGEKNYVVRIITDLKDGMDHEIIERMLIRLAPLTT